MGAYPAYKKDYDAMVFIDGWDVVAINSDGSVIDHGTAGTDDATVIQAAITYINSLSNKGMLYISAGDYSISSTISIPSSYIKICGCGSRQTKISSTSDIILIYLEGLTNVEISGLSLLPYEGSTNPVIKIYHGKYHKFEDIYIQNIGYSAHGKNCDGIYLLSKTHSEPIVWNIFKKIVIITCKSGIYLDNEVSGSSGSWTNGNIFEDIVIDHCINMVEFGRDGYTGSGTYGYSHNCFINVFGEGGNNVLSAEIGFKNLKGAGNSFINCNAWDYSGAGQYYATVDAGKFRDSVIHGGFLFFEDCEWGDGKNKVIDFMICPGNQVVTVSPKFGDYTTISAALAAITDASSSKIYDILVFGNITETTLVTAKSYINVIGIGKPVINCTATSNTGIVFSNVTNSIWRNLKIIRSGATTTASVCYIKDSSDETLEFDNCDFVNESSGVINYLYGLYISGLASPKVYNCLGVGGNGASYCYGLYLVNVGTSYFENCIFKGGNGTASNNDGIYIKNSSSSKFVGCTGISGSTTSCNGIRLSGNSSPTLIGCIGTHQKLQGSADFTGASTDFVPISSIPYYISSGSVLVTTAKTGAVASIGTTPGGSEIASGISLAVAGTVYFDINRISHAADSSIYITITGDTSAEATFYYVVGYNWNNHNGLYLDTFGYSQISNCIFEGDIVGSGIYISTGAATKKYSIDNCSIESVGTTALTCQSATTLVPVYGSKIKGLSVNVTSFAPNANNSGIGAINVNLIRPEMNSILEVLGDVRLLLPQVEITGTSITDYTRRTNTCTASTSVATWYGFQGRATYYDYNGTSYYLYRADDADFTFGDGSTDEAFSIVACVNPDGVTSRTIMAKWDATTAAEAREWKFGFDASGYPTMTLYDESANAYIGRQDQTAFATGTWKVLVATYDGGGSASGVKIYIDGVQLDDADVTDGTYVAMEDTATQLTVGSFEGTAGAQSEFYDGKMTWVGIAAKELDADEVWSLTQRLKGVLGV